MFGLPCAFPDHLNTVHIQSLARRTKDEGWGPGEKDAVADIIGSSLGISIPLSNPSDPRKRNRDADADWKSSGHTQTTGCCSPEKTSVVPTSGPSIPDSAAQDGPSTPDSSAAQATLPFTPDDPIEVDKPPDVHADHHNGKQAHGLQDHLELQDHHATNNVLVKRIRASRDPPAGISPAGRPS